MNIFGFEEKQRKTLGAEDYKAINELYDKLSPKFLEYEETRFVFLIMEMKEKLKSSKLIYFLHYNFQ